MASVRTKTIEPNIASGYPQTISLDINNIEYLGLINNGINGVKFKIASVGDEGILYKGAYRKFILDSIVSTIKLQFEFLDYSTITVDWGVGNPAPSGGYATAENQEIQIENQESEIANQLDQIQLETQKKLYYFQFNNSITFPATANTNFNYQYIDNGNNIPVELAISSQSFATKAALITALNSFNQIFEFYDFTAAPSDKCPIGIRTKQYSIPTQLDASTVTFTLAGISIDNTLLTLQAPTQSSSDCIVEELAYQNDNYQPSADYSTSTMFIETAVVTTFNEYFMLCSIKAITDVTIFIKYISALTNSLANNSICLFLNPTISGTPGYSGLQIPELEEGNIEAPSGGETPNIISGGVFICDFQVNNLNGGIIPLNRKFDLQTGDEIVLAVYARAALDIAGSIGYSKEKLR